MKSDTPRPCRAEVEAAVAKVRAEELAPLVALYEAVEKDECSATYCACQRGGMIHFAWLAAHRARTAGEEGA